MAKNTVGINKDKERGTYYVQKQYKGKTIKKRGFTSLNEAKAYLSQQMYLIDHPEEVDAKHDIPLDDLFSLYDNYRSINVRITTRNGDKQKYNVHISPELGQIFVSLISPDKIQDWKINLVKKDMTELFTNQIIGVLKGLLNYGISRDYKINNKCLNELGRVKIKKPTQERDVLTYEEIDKFLDTFNKEDSTEYEYWLYFYTLSRCGMRPNEFRALQVKDIRSNGLNVNHDITSKITGEGDILQHCKNDYSVRDVLMPPEIMELLRKKVLGYNQDDFIFGKEKAFRETNIKRMLDRHLTMANLKHITIYGFRHSHATHLIRNGVMVKVVSTRLGHKDIQTTLNTYQHLFKEDQEAVLNYL